MFFIVNKTKGNITIGDLKLNLGPRQAIDLDKVMDRVVSDKSRDLKRAVSKGVISIKRKDVDKSLAVYVETKPSSGNLDQIKNELLSSVKDGIKDAIREGVSAANRGFSPDDLTKLIEKMASMMPKNTVIIRDGEKLKEIGEEEVIIDEEILTDIHARAVDELTKDSKEGFINYNKEKVEDSIHDNVLELENLLG